MFGLTVSIADMIATFGRSRPSAWASSTAFLVMSTVSTSLGSTSIAASVTITGLV